jgi:hypothetical protein
MKKLLAIIVLGLLWGSNAKAFIGSKDICVGISDDVVGSGSEQYYNHLYPVILYYAHSRKGCFDFSRTKTLRSITASDKTMYKKLKKYTGKNFKAREMYSLKDMERILGNDYSYLGLMSSKEAEKKEAEFDKATKQKASVINKKRRDKVIAKLEVQYGEKCSGSFFNKKFEKGTKEYENCLLAEKKSSDKKRVEVAKKLSSMSPKERHAYNCSTAFKFRKGSEKFNDCVFKLYTAELDIQKLELEKQVAEAQIKAAATQQARAEAVANAQIVAAKASQRAASLNSSIQLMQLGSSMLGGSSAPKSNSSFGIENRVRTTCRNVGGFINCN